MCTSGVGCHRGGVMILSYSLFGLNFPWRFMYSFIHFRTFTRDFTICLQPLTSIILDLNPIPLHQAIEHCSLTTSWDNDKHQKLQLVIEGRNNGCNASLTGLYPFEFAAVYHSTQDLIFYLSSLFIDLSGVWRTLNYQQHCYSTLQLMG